MNVFMLRAIELANLAYQNNEIPVGAVIVHNNVIIGEGYNQVEQYRNPTLHAEMVAIKNALEMRNEKYLTDCIMYVSLEPCSMCCGALINTKLSTLYFGAYDFKSGACGSVFNINYNNVLNHKIETYGGIMEHECSILLKNFFSGLRNDK